MSKFPGDRRVNAPDEELGRGDNRTGRGGAQSATGAAQAIAGEDTEVDKVGAQEDDAGPDVPPTQVREETRLRILHVSDIHFGRTFDLSVWEYVKELVAREQPELIVCTGDIVDHGGLFMLALACQEFEQLKIASKVAFSLRSVRGNHDCGPWGNLKFPPFSWNYGLVFGAHAIDTSWIVHFSRYRSWPLWLRWPYRLLFTTGLYVQALSALIWGYVTGISRVKQDLMRQDDPDDVVLVYLDSNHMLRLATGNVDIKEVTRLKAQILNMRDSEGAKSFASRIALIHHHPLPIPDARINEGLTSFEPFLVLRNAGVLLRELNRCDVDLVLHGHKHYSHFARLGYSLDHRSEGEIAVLAAGSAGITHAEQGRNSVNFIDVFRSGRMAYTTIYFGAGAGKPVTELFRKSNFVHGMEMHKMRMHRRASERQGQWLELVNHTVDVDEEGDVVVEHTVAGHHVERDLRRSDVPVHISVSMGRVAHNTLKLSEASLRAGHSWKDKPSGPAREIHCSIDLGQWLVGSSASTSYGYSYVGFNTYATSEWETIRACERQVTTKVNTGRAEGMEFAAMVVRAPVRQLVLSLKLSPALINPEPQVRVMRWHTYPDVKLDASRQFVEGLENGWQYDADATAHEAGRLARVGDTWQLSVSNPLVGHRYEIRWRVRDAGDLQSRLRLREDEALRREVDETRRRGRAELYRSLLLNLKSDKLREQALSDFLHAFLEEFCKTFFQVPGYDIEDDLELALFAYDDKKQELRLVATTDPSTDISLTQLSIPMNEGVTGAAFKRAAPTYFVDPKLSGTRDYAAYLFKSSSDEPRWRYVVAMPIFASSSPFALESSAEPWTSASTVGVLTISSSSPASGLSVLAEGIASGSLSQEALRNALRRPKDDQPSAEHAQAAAGVDAAADAGAETQGEAEADETPTDADSTAQFKAGYSRFWTFAHLIIDVLEVPDLHVFEEEPESPTATSEPEGKALSSATV